MVVEADDVRITVIRKVIGTDSKKENKMNEQRRNGKSTTTTAKAYTGCSAMCVLAISHHTDTSNSVGQGGLIYGRRWPFM